MLALMMVRMVMVMMVKMVKMVDDFVVISYRAVWSGGGGSLVDLMSSRW